MSEPKRTLTLDFNKWRCGGDNCMTLPNGTGTGMTGLQTVHGFRCCLGQFALQLDPELTGDDLRGNAEPCELERDVPLLTDADESRISLVGSAIKINDDERTTVWEKARAIQLLFAEHNCEIELVNFPPESQP